MFEFPPARSGSIGGAAGDGLAHLIVRQSREGSTAAGLLIGLSWF